MADGVSGGSGPAPLQLLIACGSSAGPAGEPPAPPHHRCCKQAGRLSAAWVCLRGSTGPQCRHAASRWPPPPSSARPPPTPYRSLAGSRAHSQQGSNSSTSMAAPEEQMAALSVADGAPAAAEGGKPKKEKKPKADKPKQVPIHCCHCSIAGAGSRGGASSSLHPRAAGKLRGRCRRPPCMRLLDVPLHVPPVVLLLPGVLPLSYALPAPRTMWAEDECRAAQPPCACCAAERALLPSNRLAAAGRGQEEGDQAGADRLQDRRLWRVVSRFSSVAEEFVRCGTLDAPGC